MTRPLHQELKTHIPDCDACGRDQHDYCTPIVQTTETVCACFAAHPTSDAHDNAIYWWTTQGQWADKQPVAWVCPNCQTGWPEPMWRCRECGWDDGSENEPSIFEGGVTIGHFTPQRSCPDHPHWSGMTTDCPWHTPTSTSAPSAPAEEDADPPVDPALPENGRTSEKE